jgi:hypothetical protein
MVGMNKKCIVCQEQLSLAVRVPIRVDDGKPPGTPHRWRTIGFAHEHCADKFQEQRAVLTPVK